jgi:hypothetical protein
MMNKRQAIRLKRRYSDQLLKLREVAGVGVGSGDKAGSYQLMIFLRSDASPELQQQITEKLQGHPFKLITSGPFKLQPAKAVLRDYGGAS